MGARDLYRSCPAVSQISNLTVVFSSREMVCVRKAAPIVDSLYESNWSWRSVSGKAIRDPVRFKPCVPLQIVGLLSSEMAC